MIGAEENSFKSSEKISEIKMLWSSSASFNSRPIVWISRSKSRSKVVQNKKDQNEFLKDQNDVASSHSVCKKRLVIQSKGPSDTYNKA